MLIFAIAEGDRVKIVVALTNIDLSGGPHDVKTFRPSISQYRPFQNGLW